MSGIYIEGMEMPTGCETCYFRRWVDIGVGACAGCELLKELMNDDRDRLPDCPLIPVPPHGRLIDADAFDERIRIAGGFADEELSDDFKDGVQTTLLMLKTQGTIITAEEGK